MAIQEIERKEAVGTKGGRRKIDSAAEGLVMDIVQAQQYQKPIESTVRELTANAVDSQSEKEKAIEILSGKSDSSKYFIKREGALYKDSKWDPSYYDVNSFSSKTNVELIYRSEEGTGRCDSFIVRDYGVGIGKSRLEGVLSIGYSTKRNRTDSLGAFGLGAKVGLSTGSDYYTLTTVYNGYKYKIKVFSRKINSVIGAFNLDTGEENSPYEFSDGYVIYGEKTDELNYTEIVVPTLKHHKNDYINAVRTQLLYFNNVKFLIEEYGSSYEYQFKADIIYNSKNLIVSNNSPYSKPHVVIIKGGNNVETQTGVCYGYIDFKEMELEQMYGDVGIKCPIRQVMEGENGEEIVISEGVDVVPSREAVRWTPATRDFLKSQFKQAQVEASLIVEEKLKDTDLIKWLDSCRGIKSGVGGTVISRLSRIVDLNSLKPKFNNSQLEFDQLSKFFNAFHVTRNRKVQEKGELKIKSEEVTNWNSFKFKNVFIKDKSFDKVTSLYINDTIENEFIAISVKTDAMIDTMAPSKLGSVAKDVWVSKKMKSRDEILNLLKASSMSLSYDEVEVTDSYRESLKKTEQIIADSDAQASLTHDQRRELEQKLVCNTLTYRDIPYRDAKSVTESYQRSKREVKYKDIKEYTGQLFYGNRSDSSKLHFAAHLLNRHCAYNCKFGKDIFFNSEYKLAYISSKNEKHFKTHKHVDNFFGEETQVLVNNKVIGTEIKMDNAIVQWNTARKMKDNFYNLSFMFGFADIDNDVFLNYQEISKYMSKYHSDLTDYRNRFGVHEHYDDFVKFVDKVEKIQEYALADDNEGLVSFLKDEKLSNNIVDGLAVNNEILTIFNKLLEYAAPLGTLLNEIPALTENCKITDKLSMYVKDVIDWKSVKYNK